MLDFLMHKVIDQIISDNVEHNINYFVYNN